MPYVLNHIHLKSADPQASAEWWTKAFNFTIVNDVVRPNGARNIACDSENGIRVNITGPAPGETFPAGDSGVREGLEHFGFESEDLQADIARLTALGAKVVDGPRGAICFLEVPDHVRIELIQRG